MDETRLALNPTMEQENEIEKKRYRVKVLGQQYISNILYNILTYDYRLNASKIILNIYLSNIYI